MTVLLAPTSAAATNIWIDQGCARISRRRANRTNKSRRLIKERPRENSDVVTVSRHEGYGRRPPSHCPLVGSLETAKANTMPHNGREMSPLDRWQTGEVAA
jgi:hypothetical protein